MRISDKLFIIFSTNFFASVLEYEKNYIHNIISLSFCSLSSLLLFPFVFILGRLIYIKTKSFRLFLYSNFRLFFMDFFSFVLYMNSVCFYLQIREA